MAPGSSRGFVLLVKQHQRSAWGRSPTKGEEGEKAEVTGSAASGDGGNGVVSRVTRGGASLGLLLGRMGRLRLELALVGLE